MVADSGDWKLGGFELVTEVRTPLLPPGGDAHALRTNRSAPLRTKAPRRVITSPPLPALSGAGGRPVVGAAALCAPTGGARDAAGGVQDPPPLPPVLTGHVSSLPPVLTGHVSSLHARHPQVSKGQWQFLQDAVHSLDTWCAPPPPTQLFGCRDRAVGLSR